MLVGSAIGFSTWPSWPSSGKIIDSRSRVPTVFSPSPSLSLACLAVWLFLFFSLLCVSRFCAILYENVLFGQNSFSRGECAIAFNPSFLSLNYLHRWNQLFQAFTAIHPLALDVSFPIEPPLPRSSCFFVLLWFFFFSLSLYLSPLWRTLPLHRRSRCHPQSASLAAYSPTTITLHLHISRSRSSTARLLHVPLSCLLDVHFSSIFRSLLPVVILILLFFFFFLTVVRCTLILNS